jgi:hypothetical protein
MLPEKSSCSRPIEKYLRVVGYFRCRPISDSPSDLRLITSKTAVVIMRAPLQPSSDSIGRPDPNGLRFERQHPVRVLGRKYTNLIELLDFFFGEPDLYSGEIVPYTVDYRYYLLAGEYRNYGYYDGYDDGDYILAYTDRYRYGLQSQSLEIREMSIVSRGYWSGLIGSLDYCCRKNKNIDETADSLV